MIMIARPQPPLFGPSPQEALEDFREQIDLLIHAGDEPWGVGPEPSREEWRVIHEGIEAVLDAFADYWIFHVDAEGWRLAESLAREVTPDPRSLGLHVRDIIRVLSGTLRNPMKHSHMLC